MGSSEIPSAPEGQKCFIKIVYAGQTRIIQWNSSNTSFKELDTKVRNVFALKENHKLVYKYNSWRPALQQSSIVMSSDEEFASALQLNDGEILVVQLTREVRKKKGPLCRLVRAVKAKQPIVTEFVTNVYSNVAARIAASPLANLPSRIRACKQACRSRFSCPRANANQNENSNPSSNSNAAPAQQPRCCFRRKKLLIALFVVLMAGIAMQVKCHAHRSRHNSYYYNYHTQHNMQQQQQHVYHVEQQPLPHHTQQHNIHHNPWASKHPAQHENKPELTILGATYGGMDVTRQFQKFYKQNGGVVMASNAVFNDPDPGFTKFLQVVYSINNQVYSQSFPESDQLRHLSPEEAQPRCSAPDQDILHYGENIRILGALFDGQVVTCHMRQLGARGGLYHYYFEVAEQVFGSQGRTLTVVYAKNGKINTARARVGQRIHFG